MTRWHSGSAWLALCARAGYATRGRSAGQRAHPPERMVGRAGAAAADDGLPAAAAAAGDVPAGPAAGLPAGPAAGPVPGHAADGPLAGRAGRRQGPLKAERSARCRECHAGVQRWAWRAAAGASVPLPVLVVQESGRAGQLQSQPAGYHDQGRASSSVPRPAASSCEDQLRRRPCAQQARPLPVVERAHARAVPGIYSRTFFKGVLGSVSSGGLGSWLGLPLRSTLCLVKTNDATLVSLLALVAAPRRCTDSGPVRLRNVHERHAGSLALICMMCGRR